MLDESQRVPKPANERSAMTAIAKACSELSRAHTWCMSGTPVGSVVDDLLGQATAAEIIAEILARRTLVLSRSPI